MITIHTFESKTSPDRERWLACLYSGKERLPVVIPGATEEEAKARAELFLKEEFEREERRKALIEKRRKPIEEKNSNE